MRLFERTNLGFGVGVGVPGLLLHREGGLWQQALEPAGQVAKSVIVVAVVYNITIIGNHHR